MDINQEAFDVFGINGRLEKLQEELIGCAHAANRMMTGKGSYEELVHEIMDVQIVLKSVRLDPGFSEILRSSFVLKHEAESYDKLRKAIDDYRESNPPN